MRTRRKKRCDPGLQPARDPPRAQAAGRRGFSSPSRPSRHCAVAMSVSAATPRKLDAGSTPPISSSIEERPATIRSFAPFASASASAASRKVKKDDIGL
jgi:hypothetical protein